MEELTARIFSELVNVPADNRFVVGIVGYPGAGKSTLAEELVRALNLKLPPGQRAQLVPMDGYHLSNEILEELGLRALKGIPDTFDPDGFIELLTKIRQAPPRLVKAPRFDRAIEASIQDAIEVSPEVKVVVTEGNYLLLDDERWRPIAELLDDSWYLDTSFDLIKPRLIRRHMEGGKTEEGAIAKMESTDLPNARLIEKTRARARASVTAIESRQPGAGNAYKLQDMVKITLKKTDPASVIETG